jgi:hypothetical protein
MKRFVDGVSTLVVPGVAGFGTDETGHFAIGGFPPG